MLTFTLRLLLAVSPVALAMPVMTYAQAPTSDTANIPPQAIKFQEGEAPELAITQPSTEKIKKKRQDKVTEVKVRINSTNYYAKLDETLGSMRGGAQSDSSHHSQFQVGKFGSPKKHEAPEPGPDSTTSSRQKIISAAHYL